MTDFDEDITSAQMDALQETERLIDEGGGNRRQGHATYSEVEQIRDVPLREWPREALEFLWRTRDENQAAAQRVGGSFRGAAERERQLEFQRRVHQGTASLEPGPSTGYGDPDQGTVEMTSAHAHLADVVRSHECDLCRGARVGVDRAKFYEPEWHGDRPQWDDRMAGGSGTRCEALHDRGQCQLSAFHGGMHYTQEGSQGDGPLGGYYFSKYYSNQTPPPRLHG